MAKIIKLSDDVFKGKHLNRIFVGYSKIIKDFKPPYPEIGWPYYFGSFHSSDVTAILSFNDEGFVFKTLNSTYKVIYDENS